MYSLLAPFPFPFFPNIDNHWNIFVVLFECVFVKHVLCAYMFNLQIGIVLKVILLLGSFFIRDSFLSLRKKNILAVTVFFQKKKMILFIGNIYEFGLGWSLRLFNTAIIKYQFDTVKCWDKSYAN